MSDNQYIHISELTNMYEVSQVQFLRKNIGQILSRITTMNMFCFA